MANATVFEFDVYTAFNQLIMNAESVSLTSLAYTCMHFDQRSLQMFLVPLTQFSTAREFMSAAHCT